MRTVFLACWVLAASPIAWAQDGDAETAAPAEESEEADTAAETTGDEAAVPSAPDAAEDDEATEESTGAREAEESTGAGEAEGSPAPEDSVEVNAATMPPGPDPALAPPATPAPAAHGSDIPKPADRVGRKPNKPLLYAAGGLAAATAVTYGIAYSGYARAFNRDDPPYEDFEQIRQRTNALTIVTGGLAAATVGTGVTAFVVGEF